MNSTAVMVCNNDKIISRYLKAKEKLEISLKLYRLIILNNIPSEIPAASKRVKRCQAIYEELYSLVYS